MVNSGSMKMTVTIKSVTDVTNCYNCPMAKEIRDFTDYSGTPFRRCTLAPDDCPQSGMYGGAAMMIPKECPAKSGIFCEKEGNTRIIKVINVKK